MPVAGWEEASFLNNLTAVMTRLEQHAQNIMQG